MPGKQEMVNAAKIKPSDRTPAEQSLVEQGKDILEVKNTDHEAARLERIHGRDRR